MADHARSFACTFSKSGICGIAIFPTVNACAIMPQEINASRLSLFFLIFAGCQSQATEQINPILYLLSPFYHISYKPDDP